ncbi:AAA family ATPase [Dactylosporangium sp. AC04546]|uniref:AAA family ATPase n=1 Tax=Dactylosporangium sp. AC04546 TaxID=2862460 RepID=UPI001EDDB15A|nr:AAA family ATPase [Dactylosporangium sp. AC04546]WVK89038.1 AAA family ATPase [Dactylosporangium sp. AC04546]
MRTGRDPPAGAEILHESNRTRVTRLFVAGHPIICKEPLGPDAWQRVRHERAMLERLRGVAGVAQLAEAPHHPESIMLVDAGDTALADLARPLPADEVIRLALSLAGAVAGMHHRQVMHRDITPANILLSPDGAPCLADFALATPFGELRPEFTRYAEITGTLAYLAPEQTGRTGRSVDQRADLYALGATLYELATGAPPFGSGDPLQLTHAHLARVAEPPAQVNPAVPVALSEIVMHLLEKEPDDRYQTADGLLHDLRRLRDAGSDKASDRASDQAPIGEYDVPLRLLPPSRLVGRDAEVAALEAAFADALTGRCRGMLIGGMPGVGKTALVDELRTVVTGRDGWFVVGKFDEYRRDLEFDGVHQVLRALGRLSLSGPEDELGRVRARMLERVGPNVGLMTALNPEFAALLAVPPDTGDPMTAQLRAQRTAVETLRAVASPQRPIVMFLDDLQWAGRAPLGVIDALFGEEQIAGLLLVGAYREDGRDAEQPPATPLSRWRDRTGVRYLHLANLPVRGSAMMIAEMLRVDQAVARGLADVIQPYTSGNPYEIVELLNALRSDGMLHATAAGWRWDAAAVRAHLGRSEVAGLLATRVDALPPASQRMVEAMACLGGRADLSLLQTATAEPAGEVERRLAPALDDGVLVVEPSPDPAVRFRHDRIREVTLQRLRPPRLRALRLAMARRLAAVPELFPVAAEQYLPVADAVGDAAERHRVVGLLRSAAGQAALIGNYGQVNSLLTAALPLIDPDETAALVEVHTRRHAALYSIGSLDEADEEYRILEGLCTNAVDLANATLVQTRSLTHRNRFAEAIGLGLGSLRDLGIAVPAPDRLPMELDRRLDDLYRWLDRTDGAGDPARPELTEPRLLAASRLINALLPAFFIVADHAMAGWVSLETLRIWTEHGHAQAVLGPMSHAGFAAVSARGDYATGYRSLRRFLALAEARGDEPEISQIRFLLSLLGCWFEPIESSVDAARQAYEGLLAGGELANAGYTHYTIASSLLECAPSLDVYVTEVEAGLAFAHRTGSEQTVQWLETYRWLAGVLRGESTTAGNELPFDRYAESPQTLLHVELTSALAAAVLDDHAALRRHAGAAMRLLPAGAQGLYATALARLLHGLALAEQARAADEDERDAVLADLDDVTRWLATRAADAPANFQHLVRLLEAERAWAVGDFRGAALGFDAARREVAQRHRPWHRALITERAARCYLAHGIENVGSDLLAEARQDYLAWGAMAKVEQLDWAHSSLRPRTGAVVGSEAELPHRRSTVTTGTIDLLGILSASQALSSETSIEGVRSRVARVLSAMTGATDVRLLLWSEDRQTWLVPAPGDGGFVPVSGVGHEPAVPMSVLRYSRRLRAPLVVGDATRDDRFARDPYFTGVARCSLLAVPIVSRDAVQAVLLIENRLLRDAFATERLDGVKLIAGQLAVSLDNAQLYADFRRIADEQAALRRVATLVARGALPDLVFAAVAEEVGTLFGTSTTAIVRFEPDREMTVMGSYRLGDSPPGGRCKPDAHSAIASVQATGQATGQAARDRSEVASPIVVEGRVWGAMGVTSQGKLLSQDTEQRLADFTELVGTAIANAESRAELTTSRARIVAAADQTRRRIERDLHDGAQQRLVALALQFRAVQAAMPPGLGELGAQLDEAVNGVSDALEELREIARGIHPAILTEGGLRAGLRALARRSPVPVHLDMRAEGRLPEPVEISVYYIVAEALTNAARHAHASSVTVTVDTADGVLLVTIRDDGVGGANFAHGTGLVGLKDRVEALSGRLHLDSPAGAGTILRVELPLTAAHPADRPDDPPTQDAHPDQRHTRA